MAEIKNIDSVNYLLIDNERVFLPSEKINIFPCSRRGSEEIEDTAVPGSAKYYDPEARLNTERTNRIHTAINGFTDSFIVNNSFEAGDTLVFVLAGYRVEVKNFDSAAIADTLGITTGMICAHLSLHDNISLNVEDYFTEILYRQLTNDNTKNKKYLDISYTAPDSEDKTVTRTSDFFVGISFTTKEVKDTITETKGNATTTRTLPSYHLPIFVKSGDTWKLVQTSLLPKVEHGETEDSIKLSGDFTVKHGEQASFKVTEDETVISNELLVTSEGTTQAKVNSSEVIFNPPVTVNNSLTVGDASQSSGTTQIYGQTTINNDLIIAGEGHALKVDTITSSDEVDNDVITVQKPLNITGTGTTNIAGPVEVEHNLAVNTLKVDEITSRSIINNNDSTTSPDVIDVNAPVSIHGATNTQKLSATELNVANDKFVVKETDDTFMVNTTITGTLETTVSVKTPTLDVETITNTSSSDTAIIINKGLDITGVVKVDEITNKSTNEDGTAKAVEVSAPLYVEQKATLKNGLKVANGDTDLRKLAATELKVADNALTVTKDDAKFTKPVTVDSSLTSNNVQIKDKGQVPALELAQLTDDSYQLRFKFGTKLEIKDERPKTTE